MRIIHLVAAFFLSLPLVVQAGQSELMQIISDPGMKHEVELSKWNRFWDRDDYRLVTVRFRKDVNEQRFIYANKQAWDEMNKHNGKHYTNGAIFAKMAVKVSDDPMFPNSVTPNGSAMRVQLMEYDDKAPTAIRHWKYELVDATMHKVDGNAMTKDKIEACASCHYLAKDSRDEIFALPWIDVKPELAALLEDNSGVLLSKFVMREVAGLRESVRTAVAAVAGSAMPQSVAVQEMAVFAGSFHEFAPVLQEFAKERNTITLVTNPSGDARAEFAVAEIPVLDKSSGRYCGKVVTRSSEGVKEKRSCL